MVNHTIKLSETQKLQLDEMAQELEIKTSVLIRAVLYDGLKRVKFQAAKDKKESADHLKLLDARAKL